MQCSLRRFFACLALFAGLSVPACWWTPLEGLNYGAAGDPYRRTGQPEIPTRKDQPVFRVVLAGDGGLGVPKDPTLALLGKWADELSGRTQVVYLGDNIYPAGLQNGSRKSGEAILLRQLRATRAPKIFVPGNHDWGYTGTQQLSPGVLGNQQEFLESQAETRAELHPKNGCPGPSEVELLPPGKVLGGGLILLALDLHWWLLPAEDRPKCEGIDDTNAFLERFTDALDAHGDHNVLVVAHHPIRSGGPHGGQSRGFWTDLGVTLAYPFYRSQDLFQPGYQEMVRLLEAPMRKHPPLAMIGGHDHSLQVIEGGDVARVVIVSGAASRVSGVTAVDGTLFAHAHLGFVVLDFYKLAGGTEETLLVRVVETGRGKDPVFTLAIDLKQEDAPVQPIKDPKTAGGISRTGAVASEDAGAAHETP
ncbi:MAG: metallophosphoesterase [Candidatus Binatia bacterium]